jgi:hypothetical protein
LILIGMPEPAEGWLLEEVEAALFQAEVTGRVMRRDRFVESAPVRATDDILGSMM